MEKNFEKVPSIITGKDLDYLNDMFNWNYGVYKSTLNAIDYVNNTEIKDILIRASEMFYNNMNVVLNILNDEVHNEE